MKITEIYDRYRINRGLREHMLRVAAVAKLICDHAEGAFNTEAVVTACLLHDMGNIVKITFDLYPEHFEPEGIEYYKNVQKEYVAKYGSDDHEVNVAIARELGVGEDIIALIEAFGLDDLERVVAGGTLQEKLMPYCDFRVGLRRVISLDARFDDIKVRYVPRRMTEETLEGKRVLARELEREIFEHTSIAPEEITDESTRAIQEELQEWEIETL